MKIDQQRQIKKHTHRLNYLKEEIIDAFAASDAGSREINLAVFEFFARSNKRIPLNQDVKKQNQEHKPEEAQENAVQDPNVKKLFRKIAIKTHPDKLDKNNPEYETLMQAYIGASKAAALNNFDDLIQIAIELEIPVDVDHEVQVRAIEKISQKIEKQIDDLKNSPGYVWAMSPDQESKKSLLRIVMQNLNENPEPQLIDDIIAWLNDGAPDGSSYVSRDPNRPIALDMHKPGTRPQKRSR